MLIQPIFHLASLKILIISAVFPPEPVVSASLSFDLAIALSKKNEVTVISPAPSRPMRYDFLSVSQPNYPFKHLVINSYTHPKSAIIGRFRESYSFGKACAKYISNNRNEIDIIYLNTWPLFGQYFAIRAASKFNIPSVLHVQDIYPESLIQKIPVFKHLFYKILLPIDKFTTQNSSKVITISNGMRNLLIRTRLLKSDGVNIIFNWQDESKFKFKESDVINEQQTFTFMFLGSLGPVAAVDGLIKAFANDLLINCSLVVAGGGSEKESLMTLAKQFPKANIQFVDADSSKVAEIQSKSTVLLLSLKKGAAKLALPSKLPAYMFSAKPIIATVDIDSDTANAIREAKCGWVIEPENPSELADLMQKVSLMPMDELERMGMKGREYALKHFSKQANLPKLVSIIEDAIMQ